MTLPKVIVDCTSINKPGQLGVGLGRSVSKQNLQVINFHPRHCIEQPNEIKKYYEQESRPTETDLSCCRVCVIDQGLLEPPEDIQTDDIEAIQSDCESEELVEVDSVLGDTDTLGEPQCIPYLDQDYNEQQLVEYVQYEDCVTPFHTELNGRLSQLSHDGMLHPFVTRICNIIWKIWDYNTANDDKFDQAHLSKMHKQFQQYQTGRSFFDECRQLLDVNKLSKVDSHLCFRVFSYLRKEITECKTRLHFARTTTSNQGDSL
jgi:hypothetical protein